MKSTRISETEIPKKSPKTSASLFFKSVLGISNFSTSGHLRTYVRFRDGRSISHGKLRSDFYHELVIQIAKTMTMVAMMSSSLMEDFLFRELWYAGGISHHKHGGVASAPSVPIHEFSLSSEVGIVRYAPEWEVKALRECAEPPA